MIERAGNRCEYCLIMADVAFFPHEVDHVVAEKHGGATDIDNLAFACWRCNRHKGSDLTSFDPQTRQLSPCSTYARKSGQSTSLTKEKGIIGLTPEGRTTVNLLRLNNEDRLSERLSNEADE